MIVWVKIEASAQTQIVVESDALLIDDQKTAIGLAKQHIFLTSDSEDIVVRDPSTNKVIESIVTLSQPNGIEKEHFNVPLTVLII